MLVMARVQKPENQLQNRYDEVIDICGNCDYWGLGNYAEAEWDCRNKKTNHLQDKCWYNWCERHQIDKEKGVY